MRKLIGLFSQDWLLRNERKESTRAINGRTNLEYEEAKIQIKKIHDWLVTTTECAQVLSQIQSRDPSQLHPLVQMWPLLAPKKQDNDNCDTKLIQNSSHKLMGDVTLGSHLVNLYVFLFFFQWVKVALPVMFVQILEFQKMAKGWALPSSKFTSLSVTVSQIK